MKALLFTTALLLGSTLAHAADPIEGNWRQIDDRTGFTLSLVNIHPDSNGNYVATIYKRYPRPGHMNELCQNCPPPYTNKPILGMDIVTGLKPTNTPGRYVDGLVIDPNKGKTYKFNARLHPNGRSLTVRGYVGVSMLGRSQTWIRVDENARE